MKKILTSIIIICFLSSALATHNIGGEITVKQLSYLNYEATIHTYTKASSIPADRDSLIICWGDGICEYILRDTVYLVGSSIKYNSYTWQHTYTEEATYTISMTDPNRNGGQVNVNPPSSDNVPFHIQTIMVVSDFYNNTPVLLNPPLDIGYLGQIYQHNPAAIDWEGDSLSYEFTMPFSDVDLVVPNYTFPDQLGTILNGTLSLHNEFGSVNWDVPMMEGVYVIAIKIKEHRNGQVISEVTRDFEIPIRNNQNIAPSINVPINEVTLSVGDTLNFDIIGEDPEMGEILVQAIGLPPILVNPSTFIAPDDFSTDPINATFEWEIFDNHYYLNPYYLVIRIEERDAVNYGLTNYHVVKININFSSTNTTDIEEKLDVEIFPNPISSNNIFIKLNEKLISDKLTARIISLDGKLILEKTLLPINEPQTIDAQAIKNGNYFLIIDSKNKRKVFKIGVTNFSK